MISRIVLGGCLLVGCVGVASAQENYFDNWPAGVAPQEVGKHLAEHLIGPRDDRLLTHRSYRDG